MENENLVIIEKEKTMEEILEEVSNNVQRSTIEMLEQTLQIA